MWRLGCDERESGRRCCFECAKLGNETCIDDDAWTDARGKYSLPIGGTVTFTLILRVTKIKAPNETECVRPIC